MTDPLRTGEIFRLRSPSSAIDQMKLKSNSRDRENIVGPVSTTNQVLCINAKFEEIFQSVVANQSKTFSHCNENKFKTPHTPIAIATETSHSYMSNLFNNINAMTGSSSSHEQSERRQSVTFDSSSLFHTGQESNTQIIQPHDVHYQESISKSIQVCMPNDQIFDNHSYNSPLASIACAKVHNNSSCVTSAPTGPMVTVTVVSSASSLSNGPLLTPTPAPAQPQVSAHDTRNGIETPTTTPLPLSAPVTLTASSPVGGTSTASLGPDLGPGSGSGPGPMRSSVASCTDGNNSLKSSDMIMNCSHIQSPTVQDIPLQSSHPELSSQTPTPQAVVDPAPVAPTMPSPSSHIGIASNVSLLANSPENLNPSLITRPEYSSAQGQQKEALSRVVPRGVKGGSRGRLGTVSVLMVLPQTTVAHTQVQTQSSANDAPTDIRTTQVVAFSTSDSDNVQSPSLHDACAAAATTTADSDENNNGNNATNKTVQSSSTLPVMPLNIDKNGSHDKQSDNRQLSSSKTRQAQSITTQVTGVRLHDKPNRVGEDSAVRAEDQAVDQATSSSSSSSYALHDRSHEVKPTAVSRPKKRVAPQAVSNKDNVNGNEIGNNPLLKAASKMDMEQQSIQKCIGGTGKSYSSSITNNSRKRSALTASDVKIEGDLQDVWTEVELQSLNEAHRRAPISAPDFWEQVAAMMPKLSSGPRRTADQCQEKWFESLEEDDERKTKRQRRAALSKRRARDNLVSSLLTGTGTGMGMGMGPSAAKGKGKGSLSAGFGKSLTQGSQEGVSVDEGSSGSSDEEEGEGGGVEGRVEVEVKGRQIKVDTRARAMSGSVRTSGRAFSRTEEVSVDGAHEKTQPSIRITPADLQHLAMAASRARPKDKDIASKKKVQFNPLPDYFDDKLLEIQSPPEHVCKRGRANDSDITGPEVSRKDWQTNYAHALTVRQQLAGRQLRRGASSSIASGSTTKDSLHSVPQSPSPSSASAHGHGHGQRPASFPIAAAVNVGHSRVLNARLRAGGAVGVQLTGSGGEESEEEDEDEEESDSDAEWEG